MKNTLVILALSASFTAMSQRQADNLTFPSTTPIQNTLEQKQNTSPFDFIFGDSIAEGLKRAGCLGGDAKQGRKPSEILARIKAFPRDSLKGKNILLTVGAGNAPDEVDTYVPLQLKYLKQAGAARIVVMGISKDRTDINGPAMNKQIEAFAKKYGCIFGGAITNASDRRRIHPVGHAAYESLLSQAEMKLIAVIPPQHMNVRFR